MRLPDLSEIPDLTTVEEDIYHLMIKKAKDSKSTKTGREYIMLIVEFVDIDNTIDIIHNLWLPQESDDPSKAQTMGRMLKEFIVALNLDPAGVETEDFEGVEFDALVGIEDYEGTTRNVIKRIIKQ